MPIHYIVNDPFAGPQAPKIRKQTKRRDRPAGRAGFSFSGKTAEAPHEPGTPGFLYWQCRESALATLQTWEMLAGNLTAWQGKRKRLPLRQDDGVDINAYYDRQSFSFFHRTIGSRTFYSGASTDVVAHEIGHGLLDAIRPDLWTSGFFEVAAFHEAFGDCIAILTALNDRATRVKLLGLTKTLKKRNFVESTIELLATGIRALDPEHNGALPRFASNRLKHQIPETLPSDGGPGKLINEVHSFAMVFTGCFYDVLAGIFAEQKSKQESALLAAARTTGRLLVTAASTAVMTPRFFQAVGRGMVLADDSAGGRHRDIIRKAFAAHGIMLGANALLGATTVLSGTAPVSATHAIGAATKKDLAARLGVSSSARFSVESLELSGHRMARVVHTQRVPLGSIHPRLKGVALEAPVPVVLGESGGRAAVMGDIPEPVSTEREVQAFVQSLASHGQIQFNGPAGGNVSAVGAAAPTGGSPKATQFETHRVVRSGSVKTLERVRFSCGCCRC